MKNKKYCSVNDRYRNICAAHSVKNIHLSQENILSTSDQKDKFFGSEVDRIFTVGSDWSQRPLYENLDLCFVTAVFQVCPAYIDWGGEVYFINVFDIFSSLNYGMGSDQFAEIV